MKTDCFCGFTIRGDTDGCTKENLVHLWCSVGWDNGSVKVPDRLLASVNNASTVFTAWDGDKLIGLCSALDDGLNVWLSYMVVDSLYQNSGIGGFLVDKMIQHYAGCRLYVQTMNAAKFYQKHGFQQSMASLKINDLPKGGDAYEFSKSK